MKGRYSGRHMTIHGYILPRTKSIAYSAFLAESLTEEAKYRVKVLDWYRAHGNNVSLTARRFGLGRSTIHRWLKRTKLSGVIGLNDRSKRPKRARVPITSSNTVMRIVQLRRQYPAWSKYKIRVLLRKEGIETSVSTVGRILRRRGLIDKKVSRKRKNAALRPKARFPKGLRITSAGDMVQMDTKYIMLPGGKKFFQFTAIDVLTKIRVLRVYPSESSRNGAHFLREVLSDMPFPVKAVQTDNGSCFQKEFEKECLKMNLPHYFIHPRTPKENTYVERSHGSDKKEFYLQGNVSCLLPVMQEKIREWERVWNDIRPHEALGQLTPSEYFSKIQGTNLPTKNIIILQT
jgi:transposase InsO family protein